MNEVIVATDPDNQFVICIDGSDDPEDETIDEDEEAVDEAVEGATADPVLVKPMMMATPPHSAVVPSGGDSNWMPGGEEQSGQEEGHALLHHCVKKDLFR
jgi:hypothetical protein